MKKQSIDLLAKYLSGQHLLIDTHQLMKDYAAIPSFPSLFALILFVFVVVVARAIIDAEVVLEVFLFTEFSLRTAASTTPIPMQYAIVKNKNFFMLTIYLYNNKNSFLMKVLFLFF